MKNLRTGLVDRVSTSRRGRQADSSSRQPQWPPDGKRILFTSVATNLVRNGQTGGAFIQAPASGAITRVASGFVYQAVYSPNGNRIAFITKKALVSQDKNRCQDVVVKSLRTGRLLRVSGAQRPMWDKGDPADVQTRYSAWSPDGRSGPSPPKAGS